jgi:hypothetical protein
VSAVFSDDRSHRFLIARGDESAPYVLWIGLNPSTAEEDAEDATTERWWSFSRREGFSHWRAANLSAFVSTDPSKLPSRPQDVRIRAVENEYLVAACSLASKVVFCWGAGVKHLGPVESIERPKWVVEHACAGMGHKVFCLGTTKEGHPRHPLYLKSSTVFQPWIA